MRKVIGFDGWTVGSHHFQRLVQAFRSRGFELALIHLGSWGNEKGRPSEETIGSLLVRDISFYSGMSFAEILELERPSAVVFLSTEAFAHRAFNRYCRQRKVPTVHLFHGLQQLMDTAPLAAKVHRRLWLMRGHLLKALRHFWPVYARSLWETRATLGEWARFAQDIVGRARAARPTDAANDSRSDRACVYIESEVKYAIEKYGYSPAHVVAVGNPDLFSFGMPTSGIGSRLRAPIRNSDYQHVVYIETNLLHYGSVFDSKEQFIQHVVLTGNELSRHGKSLVFKPHPSTDRDVASLLSKAGVDVCSREEFIPKLQGSCACITEPSSAALMPALMGMPLFLAQYGKLSGQTFGGLITSYPRARTLRDLSAFTAVLAAEQACLDSERTMRWIEQTTGPLPAEDMPARVADVIASLIGELARTPKPLEAQVAP